MREKIAGFPIAQIACLKILVTW